MLGALGLWGGSACRAHAAYDMRPIMHRYLFPENTHFLHHIESTYLLSASHNQSQNSQRNHLRGQNTTRDGRRQGPQPALSTVEHSQWATPYSFYAHTLWLPPSPTKASPSSKPMTPAAPRCPAAPVGPGRTPYIPPPRYPPRRPEGPQCQSPQPLHPRHCSKGHSSTPAP